MKKITITNNQKVNIVVILWFAVCGLLGLGTRKCLNTYYAKKHPGFLGQVFAELLAAGLLSSGIYAGGYFLGKNVVSKLLLAETTKEEAETTKEEVEDDVVFDEDPWA